MTSRRTGAGTETARDALGAALVRDTVFSVRTQ